MTPRAPDEVPRAVLGQHLDALGIAAPETIEASVDVDEAIRRMHDKGIDCVLVIDGDRRSASSPTATRSSRSRARARRDPDRALMTRDPVVLRHDETMRSRSTRWPSAGSATSRSSTAAGRPASSPPVTSSVISPSPSAEAPVSRPRIASPGPGPDLGRRLAHDRCRGRRARPGKTPPELDRALVDAATRSST